jgi:hypothetical protein
VEKSNPKICAASAIFKPLPKVNNLLIGENSHNMVTLAPVYVHLHRYVEKILIRRKISITVSMSSFVGVIRDLRSVLKKLIRGVVLSCSAARPKLGRLGMEPFLSSCANELA